MMEILSNMEYNPAFFLLIVTALIVAGWLTHFVRTISQSDGAEYERIASPYVLYSLSIMMWILSNAYFHSPLLVALGSDTAISMALIANISSFSAFSFAYLVSCRLVVRLNNQSLPLSSIILLFLLTTHAFYVNVTPGMSIIDIDIDKAGVFTLHFGPSTKWFFASVLLLMSLTFRNLWLHSRRAKPIQQLKSLYMIFGISVFMVSTIIIHVVIPFIWNDFSLAWLPPALSITEMLLMGYALITSRFYSNRYIIYSSLSFFATCMVFMIPIALTTHSMALNKLLPVFFITAVGTALLWPVVSQRSKKIASRIVYGSEVTPKQEITSLADEFQYSADTAIKRLAKILNIEPNELQLISNSHSDSLYASHFRRKRDVLLLDELAEKISLSKQQNSTWSALYERMSRSNAALVIPIYDHSNFMTHVLVANYKKDGRLFFSEEIDALQSVMLKAQGYIIADRKVRQAQALANSIAHEMRNPLAQVQLQFESLKGKVIGGAEQRALLASIESGTSAVERGRQLIDIILREVSDSSLEQEPAYTVSANEAVCQAIKQYGFEEEEQRARIHLNLAQDFAIKVNDTLFNFVIFNLLRNSVYYFDSYPDSQIEIRTESGQFENTIYFRDTGPGIPSHLLSHIFDDFFSHNKSGGSGLGLGYCQRTMQAFGGRIECESEVGQFTEFKLVFPPTSFNPEMNKQGVSPDKTSPSFLKKPLTVMVVDDKEIQRTLVKLYLDQLGVDVVLANNGLVAYEKAQQAHIDLILMDIQMPVMNGFDATKKIKRLGENTRIIALSGESGDRELAMISEIMDGRLEKPTSKEALQALLIKVFPQHFRKIEPREADLAIN